MEVQLTPELLRLIEAKVASGLYRDQSEVVREALRLLVEQDQLRRSRVDRCRQALAEGMLQAEAGELLDGRTVAAGLRRSLRRAE